ncbi:Innexin inx1 [Orchesella cincta]|uniref:Innexin inx1 n=1 Tax=Orchesella cincta TaxID=48709 RepID=A0A1D2M245_ORCCI|nr:Innexin inx1 [Orchesella cincta]
MKHRDDHMIYVFHASPSVSFASLGPSGSVEKHDALCLLPMNLINEKTVCIFPQPSSPFPAHPYTQQDGFRCRSAGSLQTPLRGELVVYSIMLAQNIDPKL